MHTLVWQFPNYAKMAFMGNPPPACVATLTRSVRFIHLSTIDPHVFRTADKGFYGG
jgi:hypothetical protein